MATVLPPSIPASAIVSVQPGVLPAGGTGIKLIGTVLTDSGQVPIDTVQQFPDADSVSDYFGPSSKEAAVASVYFGGFEGSNIKPGAINFTQYNPDAVAAYLRGGDVSGLSLDELNALSGSLTVLLDGYTHTAASIDLSSATSFSNAATLIAAGLFASEPTEATGSACTIAGTTLTVGGTLTGTWAPGQTVTGSGVTADSIILSQLTGTPGEDGTYELSESSTVASPEAMTAKATAGTVEYDSVSGGFVVSSGITGAPSLAAFATGTLAAGIKLTSATGAVVSQGAAAATPTEFMNNLITLTQNWASFMLTFDPDEGSGNDLKYEFAQWNGGQNNRYLFACWDPDAAPAASNPATSSLGYLLVQAAIGGTALIYEPVDIDLAAFLCGAIASIDFNQFRGRTDLCFRAQGGIVPNVTTAAAAANLLANGYNYYGAYATADTPFNFLYNGSVSGPFKWIDSYVNQIWMNTGLQNNLMTLLTTVKAVPYNRQGYALIEAACNNTISAAVQFGMIVPGIVLSPSQVAEANSAAGTDISGALFNSGYYLQVKDPGAAVRAARGSPLITLWYCDGGSVQQINLASIMIQ